MKTKSSVMMAMLLLAASARMAGAVTTTYAETTNLDGTTTFTYTTTDPNIEHMAHWNWYTWGILSPSLKAGATITSANLSFDDIYNSDMKGNTLYVNLLTNIDPDIFYELNILKKKRISNNSGLYLGYWKDYDGPTTTDDYSIDFSTSELNTLYNYITTSSAFGFGFAPYCYYSNNGVKFTFTVAAPVPEPATALLFGTGVASLAAFGRRKKTDSFSNTLEPGGRA